MRSLYCGHVTKSLQQSTVDLCGWVNRRRDHGGVIFVDLRDHTGLVQIVFEPELVEVFQCAEGLRSEFVIKIQGLVRARPEGMINAQLDTGEIEVVVKQLTILNHAEPPPFPLDEHSHVQENIRLKYRYMDLRREEMQQNLRFRAKVVSFMRRYLEAQQFVDIETPFLIKATPEGARDYLVPSRVHRGSFYALPQSPQLFKQMLMMGGMDRYYQVVRCFRDEDLRADRQPEFTQLDIEASFADATFIMNLTENLIRELFAELLEVQLAKPFPQMTYAQAMRDYGSDRPDLRFPMKLVDVADLMTDVDFKVFSGPATDPRGRVVAMKVPGGCQLSRKNIEEYAEYVGIYGAKGLAYIKVNELSAGIEGLQSPILKFLPEATITEIITRVEAQTGDLIFFGADRIAVVNEAMGALRVKVGHDLQLATAKWCPLWVVDFPMFEDVEGGNWQSLHHPFTAPKTNDPQELLDQPGSMLSKAYDMVLNGTELGGGSVRIHDQKMQQAVFKLLKLNEQQIQEKFGFLVEALQYGCPPHAGIAFGLDRVVMLMAQLSSIREVIAFPKTQTASCLLTQAPATVDLGQLLELGISVTKLPE